MLLEKYSQPQNVFDQLKQHLQLRSLKAIPTGGEQGESVQERIETSLLMMGEEALRCIGLPCSAVCLLLPPTVHCSLRCILLAACLPPHLAPAAESAASCPEVEAECFYLLCAHVAATNAGQGDGDLALVATALDWLAARMHYRDRHAYAAWHLRALVYNWFGAGWGLQHWLAVQPLVAPSAAAAAGDPRVFLEACAPPLASTLMFSKGQELQLEVLAQQLGTGAQQLGTGAQRDGLIACPAVQNDCCLGPSRRVFLCRSERPIC